MQAMVPTATPAVSQRFSPPPPRSRQHFLPAVLAVAVVSGVRCCPCGFAVLFPEADTVEHLLVCSGHCMSFVENCLVRSFAHLKI